MIEVTLTIYQIVAIGTGCLCVGGLWGYWDGYHIARRGMDRFSGESKEVRRTSLSEQGRA